MAAATAIVSVSMGVMKPVLSKLTTLMGNEYTKIKGLQEKVAFLQRELSDMDALLEKMDNADELDDPQAQNWRKDIIEMSYDIEDCIDDFMHRVGEADDKMGLLKKAFQFLKTFKDRHHLANQFQEMQTRVIEASKRRKRYMLDQCISITAPVVVNPRVPALYKDSMSLVGIDAQKDELVNWASDEDKQLKVMAIVGLGGLGKTTLANEVYGEVGGMFDCKSFISISQKPEMIGLLSSLVLQLGLGTNSHACQVLDLINNLRQHLRDKRYLIVVDDLWDVPLWDIIKCVFPDNGKQSRVIVTTRHQDVVISCSNVKGDVHYMKQLSKQDSKKLFSNRIFGPEGVCPPQFIDVSCEILKKCGGLPLAIITVASILACRPTKLKEEWEQIQDCLLASQTPTNSTLTDMMHILDLSYKFLPRHLKACFLYLGTYPEDHEIDKDELVRKWVAEGFVSVSGPVRRSTWDVAESYLNTLVNRSMIQLAYRDYGFIKKPYYKLHDMMLDLILKRCRENKFIRLVHDPQAMAELQVKVRQLSIHTTADVTICRQLSQVRSLSLFRANCVPSLSELRFLRVLFLLGFPRHVERIDLTCVSQLSQLRYLKVARKAYHINEPKCHVVLPNQVRGMRRLETLEIECLEVLSLPPDIVDLPCLSHLSVWDLKLPDGIGKMKTLRTLRRFRLPEDSSGVVIESLGELTNLAELSLDCCVKGPAMGCIPMTTAWMAAWSSSLLKLSNLRKLSVASYPYSCCTDVQMSSWVSPPFPFIEELNVAGWTFSRVPTWIGGLHNLHTLQFGVEEVSNFTWDDIGTMGMLPNLILLELRVEGDVPAEGIVTGSSTGFKLLQQFTLQIKNTSHLAFEAGAMPNLRALVLKVDPNECYRATTPVGLEHLASLERIEVYRATGYNTEILPQNVEASFEAFCAMFEGAITGLPTHPAYFREVSACARSSSSGGASVLVVTRVHLKI